MAAPLAGFPQSLLTCFGTVSKQGEKFDSEDSPSDTYYGFLAEIQNAVYKKGGTVSYSAQFEIVPVEWMKASVLGLKDSVQAQPPSSPASFMAFEEAPLEDIAAALSTTGEEMSEGQWYIITLDPDGTNLTRGGAKVGRTRGRRIGGIKKAFAFGRKADDRITIKLNNRFRPRGKWDNNKIKQLLGAFLCDAVGVMDVGQASCNLIYSNAGVQQFYVDAGIPMFFNFPSMPPPDPATGLIQIVNPGPCLQNNPAAILTHWHWDHWSMGFFANNHLALANRDWIVPNQHFGVMANNFWQSVPAAHRHVMPVALPGTIGGNVQVIQCVPGPGIPAWDMNSTGLAVVVTVDTINHRRTLLPGDAAYQSIPGLGGIGNIRWMYATHHGSDRYLVPFPAAGNPIPPPNVANQGRLAYSYGINGAVPGGVHCYGHPRAPAVAAYIASGWGNPGNVASTAETGPNSNVAGRGNIMMCNNVNPPPPATPHCPFHVFPKTLV